MCVVWCLRPGVPDGDAPGEDGDRSRRSHPQGQDHLRLLRSRVLLRCRTARRRTRAHGSGQDRRGERRTLLRQRSIRLGVRRSHGPCDGADDPRFHRGRLEGGDLGGGDRLHRGASVVYPAAVRNRCDRWNHIFTLHERRGVRRPEDGPRSLRYQQCGYLCARVPLAHGVRPEANVRNKCRNSGLHVGSRRGRHHGHRSESHRRTPGIRLENEKTPASGCGTDRRGSTLDRAGPLGARGSCPPSAVVARDQCGGRQRDQSRCGDRRSGRSSVCRTAMQPGVLPRVGRLHPVAREQSRITGADHGSTGGPDSCRGACLRARTQCGDLLRPRGHRAFPGLDHGDGDGQPGDGHGKYRAVRCGRQSLAGTEQRPGVLRHGVVPARVQRVSARVRRHRSPTVRGPVGNRIAR